MEEGLEHDSDIALETSESEAGAGSVRRPRRAWTMIWRSSASDEALATFCSSLPTHKIEKSNQVGCTVGHLADLDYGLARCSHQMRSQMVNCRSKRCRELLAAHDDEEDAHEPTCPCRYKFKICLSSGSREVFQQGSHVSNSDGSSTPMERQLSLKMKQYIATSLSSGEKTTATKLFATISTMVHAEDMAGPHPREKQVTDLVKNYRRNNPVDSMVPMLALCEGNLYDQLNRVELRDRDMMILCDAQPDSRPGSTGSVPHLSDGSKTYPLRVGMSCKQLVREYVAIQNRADCKTLFHIDRTHSMVINGYVVFAFGYSDCSAHFFHMAFFCTSQKRAIDIGWCIRYINRVCLDLCNVEFTPEFVMIDADKAEFKACASDLPRSTVLMCWFHVTKNVWAQAKERKVKGEDLMENFAELYDIHYASEDDFPPVRARVLARWRNLPLGSRVRGLADPIAKQWVNSRRFAR